MSDCFKQWGCRAPIVLAAAAVAVVTQAYVLIPVSLDELARRAEYVVIGRVAGQRAEFNDRRTMILTRTTIEVEERIVGDPPSTFEISEYGGRVGNVILWAPGQVHYRDEERVLVFVCRDAGDQLRTCGAHQGRMEVVAAADGAREARGLVDGSPFSENVEEVRDRIRAAREVSR